MFSAHVKRCGKSLEDVFEPSILYSQPSSKQFRSMIAFIAKGYISYLLEKGSLSRSRIIETAFYSKRYNSRHPEICKIAEAVDVDDLKMKLIIYSISELDLIDPKILPESMGEYYSVLPTDSVIPSNWWDKKIKYSYAVRSRIESKFGRLEDYESIDFAKMSFLSIQKRYIGNPSLFAKATGLTKGYSNISKCQTFLSDLSDFIEFRVTDSLSAMCGERRGVEISKRAKTYIAYVCKNIIGIPEDKIYCSDIHLGFLANFDWIKNFVEHRKKELGNYTSGMIYDLREFASHLYKGTGWVALDRDDRYSSRVEYPSESMTWEDYCMATREKILSYVNVIKKDAINTRVSLKDAAPILNKDSPILAVMRGLDTSFETLRESKIKDSKKIYLEKLKRHVLVFMMVCFPLRAKHWMEMTFDGSEDNGNLFYKNSKSIFVRIPTEEFKNKDSEIFKDRIPVEFNYGELLAYQKHVELIKEYILLLSETFKENFYVFPDSNGKKIKHTNGISDKIHQWSFEYLSNASPYSSRVAELLPFRAHVMRAIVATDFCKRGLYSEAAALLCDTLETVLKHYARITVTTRLKKITEKGYLVEDNLLKPLRA